ncbi:Atu4866 domain-containing protein [Streptomyces radicis]|uniref:Amidohydrolase n=1 Tax=Streptomyces radicis TaxID=1750517 RepID=A0A3A9VSL5_9ACTN|nr:Atu4866 domain-containing protein [Streptomyces radicis]RKN03759.1 amidohydrolase [Streptomyces radicis]RKN13871.1 amidohydrolase [Streptomyces radicis]
MTLAELRGTATLDRVRGAGHRPLLFAHATLHTADPLIGGFPRGDLLLGGDVVVGVGPGIITAAEDDDAVVIDCSGATIVPATIDAVTLAGRHASRSAARGSLAPGQPATFAVIARADADLGSAAADLVALSPAVLALVVDGAPVLWNGRWLTDAGPASVPGLDEGAGPDAQGRVGRWIDETGFLIQELTAEGRYTETRGGRPHAFDGTYRIEGDRIDYLDDLGFWAFGTFDGDTLRHAGYVMRRA